MNVAILRVITRPLGPVLASLLIGPSSLAAQVRLEPHAGVAIARVQDSGEKMEFRPGPLGGMGLVIPLSHDATIGPRDAVGTFFLRPEASAVRKGGRLIEGAARGDLMIDYFEIPLGFGFEIESSDHVRGRFYGGPSFAFQLQCVVRLSSPESFGSIQTDCDDPGFDGELHTKSFDLGLRGSAGIVLGSGAGVGVTLDGGVEYSLTPIADDPSEPRHLAILLSAGLSIPVGGER